MIKLTDTAAGAARAAIAGSAAPVEGLRLMVEAGGCAGLKYAMGLVAAPKSDDIVIEEAGIRIYLDAGSAERLCGTIVDFVSGPERTGFTFDNPNAISRCSCSRSFA